ncbi:MAG TPA: glycosyltransferase family 39 protein [Methanoregula sp.]|nr:glycosyltransferase family 39 protein [Methanoregula sp.]
MATGGTDAVEKHAPEKSSRSAGVRAGLLSGVRFASECPMGPLFGTTARKILVVLTLAGLILRFWHLGAISFWYDEAATAVIARGTLSEIWNSVLSDRNPPTFYWIEHFMLWFGSGEAVLRFIPALIGTCTIPVFYLLGKEFHNRTTGILAAALLTFSAFHISYSQEARPYTLFLFCFSLALLFYFRAGRTNAPGTWLLFGLFSGLACWSHLFGFVMVLPLFLMAFVSAYRHGKDGFSALRPVFFAGAFWFLFSLPMAVSTLYAGFLTPSAGSWGLRDIHVITSVLWFQLGQNYLAVLCLFIVFLSGLFLLYRHNRERFFFIAAAVGLPVCMTIAIAARMTVASQYLIGLLPFFCLVTGYCISTIDRPVFTSRLSCITLLVLVAISVPSLYWYYTADAKNGQDWRGFAQTLENRTEAGDTILVFPQFYTDALTYYYDNGTDRTTLYGIEDRTALEITDLQNLERRRYLVTVGNITGYRTPGISQWAAEHTALSGRYQELYLYQVT